MTYEITEIYIYIIPLGISMAYAEGTVSLWMPCFGHYDENKQPMVNLGHYTKTTASTKQEYEAKYCVSRTNVGNGLLHSLGMLKSRNKPMN